MSDFMLHDITTPSLTPSFGEDLDEQFKNIDTNFKNILSSEFLKGADGLFTGYALFNFDSLNNPSDIFYKDGTLINTENLQKKICDAIFEGSSNQTLSGIYNQVILFYTYDGIQKTAISSLPFIYRDPSVYNANISQDVNIEDRSCVLIFENDVFIKNRIIPTIYFNSEIGDFCWKIHGYETGLVARGIKGDKGEDGSLIVVQADYVGGNKDKNITEFPDNSNIYKITKILIYKDGRYIFVDLNEIDTQDYLTDGTVALVIPDKYYEEGEIQENVNGFCISPAVSKIENNAGLWYVYMDELNSILSVIDMNSIVNYFMNININNPNMKGLFIPGPEYNKSQTVHMLYTNDNEASHLILGNTENPTSLTPLQNLSDFNIFYPTTFNYPIITKEEILSEKIIKGKDKYCVNISNGVNITDNENDSASHVSFVDTTNIYHQKGSLNKPTSTYHDSIQALFLHNGLELRITYYDLTNEETTKSLYVFNGGYSGFAKRYVPGEVIFIDSKNNEYLGICLYEQTLDYVINDKIIYYLLFGSNEDATQNKINNFIYNLHNGIGFDETLDLYLCTISSIESNSSNDFGRLYVTNMYDGYQAVKNITMKNNIRLSDISMNLIGSYDNTAWMWKTNNNIHLSNVDSTLILYSHKNNTLDFENNIGKNHYEYLSFLTYDKNNQPIMISGYGYSGNKINAPILEETIRESNIKYYNNSCCTYKLDDEQNNLNNIFLNIFFSIISIKSHQDNDSQNYTVYDKILLHCDNFRVNTVDILEYIYSLEDKINYLLSNYNDLVNSINNFEGNTNNVINDINTVINENNSTLQEFKKYVDSMSQLEEKIQILEEQTKSITRLEERVSELEKQNDSISPG